jgi:hypothetical protein
MSEYPRLVSPLAAALIVFGAILIIGAIIAYNYEEAYNVPLFGTVTKYPYRDYAFPLGVIGAAAFFAGLAVIKSESGNLKI